MFNPCNETIALPDPILPIVFEVISEDAVHDQYLAWRNESYGFVMNVLGSSHSEVEIEAARLLILDKEWQVKYSDFYEEAYAYVIERGDTWTRLFKSDLRSETRQMVGLQETALASLFTGLMDQLADATAEACEREDRAYPARSAGRFAKAS
ncbi:MAG: hypothetical protein BroJett018_37760 [Chloroflexota bacterium]|nr:hypothetical protein [Chloroflexota bacterium]NOG64435.1 hypothetical protein [Chloroflexota bacterium]GIK65982.1 MAG: hypothetical protein BroJett018_37760 [Chloroflexota bacterium]